MTRLFLNTALIIVLTSCLKTTEDSRYIIYDTSKNVVGLIKGPKNIPVNYTGMVKQYDTNFYPTEFKFYHNGEAFYTLDFLYKERQLISVDMDPAKIYTSVISEPKHHIIRTDYFNVVAFEFQDYPVDDIELYMTPKFDEYGFSISDNSIIVRYPKDVKKFTATFTYTINDDSVLLQTGPFEYEINDSSSVKK